MSAAESSADLVETAVLDARGASREPTAITDVT